MKRKQEKPAYDRIAAGERLRCRRLELGWSRELVAERLGVVNKYYADIERGTCGMSVETLINLSRLYGVSLDTLFYPQIGVKPCSMAGGGVSKNIWNCFRTAPEGTGQPLTCSTSGMGLRLK